MTMQPNNKSLSEKRHEMVATATGAWEIGAEIQTHVSYLSLFPRMKQGCICTLLPSLAASMLSNEAPGSNHVWTIPTEVLHEMSSITVDDFWRHIKPIDQKGGDDHIRQAYAASVRAGGDLRISITGEPYNVNVLSQLGDIWEKTTVDDLPAGAHTYLAIVRFVPSSCDQRTGIQPTVEPDWLHWFYVSRNNHPAHQVISTLIEKNAQVQPTHITIADLLQHSKHRGFVLCADYQQHPSEGLDFDCMAINAECLGKLGLQCDFFTFWPVTSSLYEFSFALALEYAMSVVIQSGCQGAAVACNTTTTIAM
jgi:hypothetical protein